MQIEDKAFVVTGGGNGIGREIVLELVRRGARVAAVDLDRSGLLDTAELASAPRDHLSTHVVSVTDRTAVFALPGAVANAHGQVDGLLNVAGIIQPFEKVLDLEFEVIERVMNVNFWGVVNMTKAFLPHLLERPSAALLNVSSMGGFLPVPGQAAYGASKAAVKLFTEALFVELRNTPVAVTVVFPGGVDTHITEHSGVSMPGGDDAKLRRLQHKLTSPEDAARQIISGLEKGAFRVCIGSDARLMDRLARLWPRRATLLIANQMKSLLAD